MYMTYYEFKKEFDNGSKGMKNLSRFNRENPDTYRRYRDRMRAEDDAKQRERNSRI